MPRTKKTTSPQEINTYPVAVATRGKEVALVGRAYEKGKHSFFFTTSKDGVKFSKRRQSIVLVGTLRKDSEVHNFDNFRITATDDGYLIAFTDKRKRRRYLMRATSRDLKRWQIQGEVEPGAEPGAFVGDFSYKDQHIAYFGHKYLHIALSKDGKSWKKSARPIMSGRAGMFDEESVVPLAVVKNESGLILLYDASREENGMTVLQAGVALFAWYDPEVILWRSDSAIWRAEYSKTDEARLLGATVHEDSLLLYTTNRHGEIHTVTLPLPWIRGEDLRKRSPLVRGAHNPIISPRADKVWENKATFNPAAVRDDKGNVHLLYRAIGDSDMSVLGHAVSSDGMHFIERSVEPVYVVQNQGVGAPSTRYPFTIASGGGWNGGCEDPRAVRIDDTVYITYTAFDGWGSLRMGLTSFPVADLEKRKLRFSKPVLMSAKGQVSKNWVMFPDKINGKFALLNSLSPKLSIAYVDDLEFKNGPIDSYYHGDSGRTGWDKWVRGAGPPPIPTKHGWLLFYHAMDHRDPGRYKLGAMLLDNNDPSMITHRSSKPFLEPDEVYENEGKAGVIYACGAVVMDGILYIYYGGGDQVTCVASTPLDEMLSHLRRDREEQYVLQRVDY